MPSKLPLVIAALTLALGPLGCFEDPVQEGSSSSNGDGDGDNDTTGDGDPATGDGDGDATGDGDGDATGDGDGDTAGDGDGDACDGEVDECGVCNGPGGPCLGCTVPQASNYDELAEIDNGTCYCNAVGNPIMDQVQIDDTVGGGGMVIWQSFTVEIGGGLARVDARLYSPLDNVPSPATLQVFEGEGPGGTELANKEIMIQPTGPQPMMQEFSLTDPMSAPVPLAAGRVYTFQISVPAMVQGWVSYNDQDPYDGGVSNLPGTSDLVFRTNMVSCVPE